MTSQPFFWEIQDLLKSFVNAFDGIIINRYDSNRTSQTQVQARYLYAPKQRILYDLVNKQGNITLPVVSVWITGVSWAKDRVFNKLNGFNFPTTNRQTTGAVGSPIPVDISVSMSIITKFQSDMDQILSNFLPNTNPYIVLSWKIPLDFNLSNLYEIRSQVLWNGALNLTYPVELAATEKYKVTADTSFVIKGWIFPEAKNTSLTNIYYISAFHHVKSLLTSYETMFESTLSYPVSTGLVQETETVVVSAAQPLPVTYLTDESGNYFTTQYGQRLTLEYDMETLNTIMSGADTFII